MSYDQGDSAHFHAEFRDPHTNSLVDPSTVKFKFETPVGVETVLIYPAAALTRSSAGLYQATVDLNAGGTWSFRWETTGTYQGAEEFSRDADTSHF